MAAAQKKLFGYDRRKLHSLTSVESDACNHIGHEYFCKTILLVKHKTLQICESAVFFDLSPDITDKNCKFKIFFNITPKTAILDEGDTLLLSNLDKPSYLHCNEHNNEPIPT